MNFEIMPEMTTHCLKIETTLNATTTSESSGFIQNKQQEIAIQN